MTLADLEFLLFVLHCALLPGAMAAGIVHMRIGRGDTLRTGLSLGALLMLVAALVVRALVSGRLPLASLYEFGALMLVGVEGLIVLVLGRLAKGLPGVMGLGAAFALSCVLVPLFQPARDLMPVLESPWLVFHVLTAVAAYGLCTAAFVTGLTGLLAPVMGGDQKLAANMEQLGNRLIFVAFPFLTLMIASGAVWAEYAWGSFWRWDPKEIWALITWLVYLLHLHGVRVQGWTGRRALLAPVLGWCVVLFSFFGVNLLFAGLHSYR